MVHRGVMALWWCHRRAHCEVCRHPCAVWCAAHTSRLSAARGVAPQVPSLVVMVLVQHAAPHDIGAAVRVCAPHCLLWWVSVRASVCAAVRASMCVCIDVLVHQCARASMCAFM